MKRDGWIREASGLWILRFRYDWESWDQNPKVWIERGRLESNGIPLLKNRKRTSRGLAKKLWMELFDEYKHDSEKAEIFWPEILTKIRKI